MFGYRDCVVEPASGAEVGAEPAEMQIEGGGEAGGRIVCAGTPEDVAGCGASVTGRYLAEELGASSRS